MSYIESLLIIKLMVSIGIAFKVFTKTSILYDSIAKLREKTRSD